MHPSCDSDKFSDAGSDAGTIACSPPPRTPTHSSSGVFIIKTLATGGTSKYRAHCDPEATLANLRDTLHNDDDNIMSIDDRFLQGDFHVVKSAEPHTKWRDILQDNVIGILSRSAPPASTLPMGVSPSTSTKRNVGDHPLSSSLPPATTPLHRITRQSNSVRLYGNFSNGGYSSPPWKHGVLVCRIWKKPESGMVPLRQLYSPQLKTNSLFANDEAMNWWIEHREARVEYTVGYVYPSDSLCPQGAVPLYGACEDRIDRHFTLSKDERDLCVLLGATDLGTICYVAPP